MARGSSTKPAPAAAIRPDFIGSNESLLLLHEKRLSELVTRFWDAFDIVIVDTPPLLPIPDARVIGRTADAVVVVIRSARTLRDALGATQKRLEEDGIAILGIV